MFKCYQFHSFQGRVGYWRINKHPQQRRRGEGLGERGKGEGERSFIEIEGLAVRVILSINHIILYPVVSQQLET